jgi:XTP/dITP diphosphohydrolase
LNGLLRRVTFVSSNRNKFLEVRSILSSLGIEVDFAQMDLPEIQSDSLEEIAKHKVKSAFATVGRPVIVEDDGLFIESLNGFPGPYASFVFEAIGNEGILKLLAGKDDHNRAASFRSAIAFSDGATLSVSVGAVEGSISLTLTKGGWGYDPIFVPRGSDLTFAQLGAEKDRFSHRRAAFEKFAQWLTSRG